MSQAGTSKPHGLTAGYLVVGRLGVGTLCHGDAPGSDEIRFGNPGTLFPTLRRARRAIADSVKHGLFAPNELSVLRVAPPADGRGDVVVDLRYRKGGGHVGD